MRSIDWIGWWPAVRYWMFRSIFFGVMAAFWIAFFAVFVSRTENPVVVLGFLSVGSVVGLWGGRRVGLLDGHQISEGLSSHGSAQRTWNDPRPSPFHWAASAFGLALLIMFILSILLVALGILAQIGRAHV